MEKTFKIELGVLYEVEYNDGSKLRFHLIGGPEAFVKKDDGEWLDVLTILKDVKRINKICE